MCDDRVLLKSTPKMPAFVFYVSFIVKENIFKMPLIWSMSDKERDVFLKHFLRITSRIFGRKREVKTEFFYCFFCINLTYIKNFQWRYKSRVNYSTSVIGNIKILKRIPLSFMKLSWVKFFTSFANRYHRQSDYAICSSLVRSDKLI